MGDSADPLIIYHETKGCVKVNPNYIFIGNPEENQKKNVGIQSESLKVEEIISEMSIQEFNDITQ